MSAIAGIFHYDFQPVDTTDLDLLDNAMAHHGADHDAVWSNGPVGLCHRLRWTTPESKYEKLPYTHPSGAFVITADAMLTNRRDLISALDLIHSPYLGDSHIILAAYEKWGEACVEKIMGDFAFALWDAHRRVLFCARDHFGVRPFHYHDTGREFVFATDLNAILALPRIPRRLNEERVADYLSANLEDRANTCYQDILRLPAAHALTVSANGLRLRRYWRLDPDRELPPAADPVYAEQFHSLFTDSVRGRMRSAYPLGAMLSGGLDSSGIVAVARALREKSGRAPLHTFSAVFSGQPYDERAYIDAVIGQGGVAPYIFEGAAIGPLDDLEDVIAEYGEMFLGPNFFLHRHAYAEARSRGVRIVLDGFDGDTTVSHGAGYLTELGASGQWLKLWREVAAIHRVTGYSAKRILRRRVIEPLAPRPLWKAWRRLRDAHAESWNPIINPDYALRIDLAGRLDALGSRVAGRTERADHHASLTSGLMQYSVELFNRTASSAGIQIRLPFCDVRLAEFCLALPVEQKLRNGYTRFIMRNAITELPDEVRWRPTKSEYGQLLTRAMPAIHRDRIEDVMRNAHVLAPYVNLPVLRKCYARYLANPMLPDTMTVWRTLVLSNWLRLAKFA